jgi:hypothetical protein
MEDDMESYIKYEFMGRKKKLKCCVLRSYIRTEPVPIMTAYKQATFCTPVQQSASTMQRDSRIDTVNTR